MNSVVSPTLNPVRTFSQRIASLTCDACWNPSVGEGPCLHTPTYLLDRLLVLKELRRMRRLAFELEVEVKKKETQIGEKEAQRQTEKALLDTERKRAELKLAVRRRLA